MGIFDNWVDPQQYWKQHGFWGGLEQAGLIPPQRQNLLNQPVAQPQQPRQPRTVRNMNPIALSLDATQWEGLRPAQTDVQLASEHLPMAQFTNPLYGARAAARNFRTKFRRGNTTVGGLIAEHLGADKPLNQQNNLTRAVSNRLGVKADQPINLDDDAVLLNFLDEVANHETGQRWDRGILETGIWMERPATATPPQVTQKPIAHKPPQAYNTQPVGYAPAPLPPQPSFGRSGGLLPDMETAVRYSQFLQEQARRNRV